MNDRQETSSGPARELAAKIDSHTAVAAVLGLGYVGLPLLRAIHDAGFSVIGIDEDQAKIEKLRRGENYLSHLGSDLAATLASSDRFEATADAGALARADAIFLCLPTPLGRHREPDLSYVVRAAEIVAQQLRRGQLIVLESTTYPGTTRDVLLPILQQAGGKKAGGKNDLHVGVDYFLAYSPEREDPGRRDYTTTTIPRIVGGVDDISADLAASFYAAGVVEHVHRVSSAEAAEAAKLLENIYRAVNVALVNELKVILSDMDIDVWEVIEAAATKPFGYHAFYPGPGLGGHCIPIDPFYLAWKAKETGNTTKFIELAGEVNASMPRYVVNRIADALNDDGKALRGANVLIVGVAYKPDVDDMRESPAAAIIELLQAGGATVQYHDPRVPHFPHMRHHRIELSSIPLTAQAVRDSDCVVIVTNHTGLDYEMIGREAGLIVDTRNAMRHVSDVRGRVVRA